MLVLCGIAVIVAGSSDGSTGRCWRLKCCAGVPSERPMTSPRTTSACTVGAVPPMVKAVTDRICGEAVYVGWSGSAWISRHRNQPPRCRAMMEAW